MNSSITIITINFNTEEYTIDAIKSINKFYPKLKLLLIDNGSRTEKILNLSRLNEEIENLEIIFNKKNIHHGPAMDIGIRKCDSDWALTFDSDALAIKNGFIEKMLDNITDNTYAIGEKFFVDRFGYKQEKNKNSIEYIHPFCALFRIKYYLALPPFEKHGAPCLKNLKEAQKQGFELKHFPIQNYVKHEWKGTVKSFGYNLGFKSKVRKFIRKIMMPFER
ncbi:MAG: glycosyltransferase family 2 protein [Ignavibacteriales bacterium]|nr:glycosyltransferase family 2 protein [Ignavibacteriales bacterium]